MSDKPNMNIPVDPMVARLRARDKASREGYLEQAKKDFGVNKPQPTKANPQPKTSEVQSTASSEALPSQAPVVSETASAPVVDKAALEKATAEAKKFKKQYNKTSDALRDANSRLKTLERNVETSAKKLEDAEKRREDDRLVYERRIAELEAKLEASADVTQTAKGLDAITRVTSVLTEDGRYLDSSRLGGLISDRIAGFVARGEGLSFDVGDHNLVFDMTNPYANERVTDVVALFALMTDDDVAIYLEYLRKRLAIQETLDTDAAYLYTALSVLNDHRELLFFNRDDALRDDKLTQASLELSTSVADALKTLDWVGRQVSESTKTVSETNSGVATALDELKTTVKQRSDDVKYNVNSLTASVSDDIVINASTQYAVLALLLHSQGLLKTGSLVKEYQLGRDSDIEAFIKALVAHRNTSESNKSAVYLASDAFESVAKAKRKALKTRRTSDMKH